MPPRRAREDAKRKLENAMDDARNVMEDVTKNTALLRRNLSGPARKKVKLSYNSSSKATPECIEGRCGFDVRNIRDLLPSMFRKYKNTASNVPKTERCRIDSQLFAALKRCVDDYFVLGSRSDEKLIPMHSFIRRCIQAILDVESPGEFEVVSVDIDSKREYKAPGFFNNKDVDVAVLHKKSGLAMGAVSVKFIMSNYGQNANNYLENMIGECQNLKLANPHIVFWYFFATFNCIPYHALNKDTKQYYTADWRNYTKSIVSKHVIMKRLAARTSGSTAKMIPDTISTTFMQMKPTVRKIWQRPGERGMGDEWKGRISSQCEAITNGGAKELDWLGNLIEFCNAIKTRTSNPRILEEAKEFVKMAPNHTDKGATRSEPCV